MSQHLLEHIPINPITLAENQSTTLLVGQLFLSINHIPLEWHTEFNIGRPVNGSNYYQYGPLTVERYVVNQESNNLLSLTPSLADRAIVSRPMEPITILPGSHTTIYVGTPMFMAIKIDDIKLRELPLVLLSDTWFGPSTRQGELCYSTTTRARLDPSLLTLEGYKAVTPLSITNLGEKSLTLDRISVPVPFLSLYRQPNGEHLTSTINVESNDNIADAKLYIEPPDDEAQLHKISDPRKPMKKKILYRTLDLVFA